MPNSVIHEHDLYFAWLPPSGPVKAVYRAEVLQHDTESDRYLCRLVELVNVERHQPHQEISDEALRGLMGKCVRVPSEALKGVTLRLKMSTLTGGLARPYFFDYNVV